MDKRGEAMRSILTMDRMKRASHILPVTDAEVDAALAVLDSIALKKGDEGAWSLKTDDSAITYMCGVNWQHDLLSGNNSVDVFPSEAALRKNKRCVDECGIVEVEMRVRRWVQPQNLHGESFK